MFVNFFITLSVQICYIDVRQMYMIASILLIILLYSNQTFVLLYNVLRTLLLHKEYIYII